MLFYKFISYIFHPLLFSFIGSFLYLFLTPKHISKKQEYIILLVVFISTYILPLFFLLILKQFKLIKNYHLETINERKFPVIFFIVLSIMVGKMLMKTQIVDLLAYSFFGIAFALSITYLLFKYNIKTSLHTLGIGGITGFVVIMSYEYQLNFNLLIACLFILSGIIALSRLKLEAHTPKEIYIGFLIGFLTQIGSYLFALSGYM